LVCAAEKTSFGRVNRKNVAVFRNISRPPGRQAGNRWSGGESAGRRQEAGFEALSARARQRSSPEADGPVRMRCEPSHRASPRRRAGAHAMKIIASDAPSPASRPHAMKTIASGVPSPACRPPCDEKHRIGRTFAGGPARMRCESSQAAPREARPRMLSMLMWEFGSLIMLSSFFFATGCRLKRTFNGVNCWNIQTLTQTLSPRLCLGEQNRMCREV